MGKYEELRQKYKTFEYQGYTVEDECDSMKITYKFYQDNDITFSPSWILPYEYKSYTENKNKDFIDLCIFNLGMVELVSYWKSTCSPIVKIFKHLTKSQEDFWKKLYYNGLGEFFYTNRITTSIDTFMQIISPNREEYIPKLDITPTGNLVPVGGGKDSIVTLEKLKNQDNTCFIINPLTSAIETSIIAGYKPFIARRNLDKKIIELNFKGFLNGHTPFSAIVAFASYLTAVLFEKKYIILSNEASANDVYVKDTHVNHQYSKSIEFENDFRQYVEENLSDKIQYFSLLRTMNEWQIVREFVKYEKYFKAFKSCNLGSKENIWCNKCSKCLFVYIMLSPFLSDKTLLEIFGENLLDKEEMSRYLDGLVNENFDKPFECIGTREEINAALTLSVKRGKKGLVLDIYKEKYFNDSFDFSHIDNFHEDNNNIPTIFKIAEYFKDKTVLILGFGREGRSSYDFLNKFAQPKSITISDEKRQPGFFGNFGENYKENLDKYDVVLKSPGIALFGKYQNANITSQTDLFLRFTKNIVIGITGTKGKSTTSCATHFVFVKNHIDSRLVGNIGMPVFSDLGNINNKTIVVYELSCHQLEYLHKSPQIAILLNIFPDHLDHYESFETYKYAKENIYRFQKKSDVLITYEQKPIPSTQILINSLAYEKIKTKLLAKHNKINLAIALKAACTAAALADIKENIEDYSCFEDFEGLEHRLEYFTTIGEVKYYNDSIATIPEATINAINSIPDLQTLIIGGLDRGIPYEDFAEKLSNCNIQNIICMYESGKHIFSLIKHPKPQIFFVPTLEGAVSLAKQITRKGSCLLSPAAASYGHFKNFEERGTIFKNLVKKD